MLRSAGVTGSVGAYGPATLLAAAMVMRKRGITHATPMLAAVSGAASAAWLLKRVIRRPRPPAHEQFNHPSFPSGHTTRASAAALAIAYTLVRERMTPRSIAMPAAIGISLLTGVSRAYADAHWTTDVIGGWALGTACAASTALWYERIRTR